VSYTFLNTETQTSALITGHFVALNSRIGLQEAPLWLKTRPWSHRRQSLKLYLNLKNTTILKFSAGFLSSFDKLVAIGGQHGSHMVRGFEEDCKEQ
jgi:hypothetical protein